eukprot:g24256.t1
MSVVGAQPNHKMISGYFGYCMCYTGSILVKGTFFKEAFKHKGLRVPDQSVVDHEDALGGQQKSRTVIIIALPPTRSALGETLHSLQLSSRLNSIAAQRIFLPEQPSEDDACLAFARQEAERLRLENARMRAQARAKRMRCTCIARELELRELREQIQACVHSQVRPGIQQVQCGSAEKWRSTSPPSPVLEADSSAEMSREIAEQATKATPDGLHVMPGPDVMDSAGAERRTLDFTETCEGGMFNSSLCPHGPTASTDEPAILPLEATFSRISCHAMADALLSWGLENSAFVHDGIDLFARSDRAARGLRTRRPLQAKEVLLRIPGHMSVQSHLSLMPDSPLSEFWRRRCAAPVSFLQSSVEVDLPIWWPESDLQGLKGTALWLSAKPREVSEVFEEVATLGL